MKINITESFLEVCGDNSLLGLVTKQGIFPQKLVLSFEQSSMTWRRENGGPKEYIMPEFVVGCIIKDVVYLQQQGVTIEVVFEDK